MDVVPKPMADNMIVNLQSNFEDEDDQLQESWSAIENIETSESDHTDNPQIRSQVLLGPLIS